MSAALSVTKYAEGTGLLPEPAGNSLRNYFTLGVAMAIGEPFRHVNLDPDIEIAA